MTPLCSEELAAFARDAGLAEPALVVTALHGSANAPAWTCTLDAERPHSPASMIKVPIAVGLAAACAAGTLSLRDTTAVAEANLTTNDVPSPFVAGGVFSLGALAHAMLAASDNTATNVLIDVVGRGAIDAACRDLGLTATAVRRKLSGSLPLIGDPEATGRNAHPAGDAARLFVRLARPDAPRFILNALAAQVWNDKLSRGFRPGDRFAHKTGETDDVSHDGGILTLADGRRFVVVAYTALPASPDHDARFAAFAAALRARLDA
jgi:beta-lactamase class A